MGYVSDIGNGNISWDFRCNIFFITILCK